MHKLNLCTSRGTRDQIANMPWIIEKAREFQKNIYFCFTDYTNAFDCVDDNTLWKILKEMGILDHLTCLLRTLYAGQEATVRTGHGTTDWFQIGKGVVKAMYCHPAYLTSMQSTSCEMPGWMKHKLESRLQGEIPITSDMQMTCTVESEEELKSLLMKVIEESEKASLKLNIQKTKIMASGPVTSQQIDGETMETVTDYFLGLQNHCGWWLQPDIKRHLLLRRKAMTNLYSILKSTHITVPTKVHTVKFTVFADVIYGCGRCTIKKADHQRIDVFKLWCWRRLLRAPWTARRSNQSILEKINPEYSL